MFPHRLLTLLATGLLLSTLACSKKEDAPAAKSVGTGSYKLNGVLRNCEAQADTSSFVDGYGQRRTRVEITLLTTPQPASGTETLKVRYYKDAGQASTAYRMIDAALAVNGTITASFISNVLPAAPTIVAGSARSFSGTFSATGSTALPNQPFSTVGVSDGVFTNAQL